MYIVSSCLIGKQCRYDGTDNLNQAVIKFLENKAYIDVCPEELGGLQTPRVPAEILNNQVVTRDGIDVTAAFVCGASETVKVAQANECTNALLKAKSPSCGCGEIYDGTHSGTLINGDGITTKALKEIGISIMNENDLNL